MIPLFKTYSDSEDIQAVNKVISSGINWAIGPEISFFEERIASYIGAKYCVVFNSGTSALHAVLLAYGITGEVIVPSFTFVATANAVRMAGAEPIFADIEEVHLGLDPEDILRKINERTKAIIPVHYAGCPCLIEEIRDIADKYHLILIEDACEAMGATVKGKKVGTFGDAGVFSFCQNKIISTGGEGGAVVTDNPEIYRKLKLLVSHGKVGEDCISLGYNFRMSSMQAAMGITQLNKIDRLIEMRRNVATYYGCSLLPSEGNVFQLFPTRLPDRDGMIQRLKESGIGSKVHFHPIHKMSYYNTRDKLPITERISLEILSLPMYPDLTMAEVERIKRTMEVACPV